MVFMKKCIILSIIMSASFTLYAAEKELPKTNQEDIKARKAQQKTASTVKPNVVSAPQNLEIDVKLLRSDEQSHVNARYEIFKVVKIFVHTFSTVWGKHTSYRGSAAEVGLGMYPLYKTEAREAGPDTFRLLVRMDGPLIALSSYSAQERKCTSSQSI